MHKSVNTYYAFLRLTFSPNFNVKILDFCRKIWYNILKLFIGGTIMPLVLAKCTQCGGIIEVDDTRTD